jgi:hypothetical protein
MENNKKNESRPVDKNEQFKKIGKSEDWYNFYRPFYQLAEEVTLLKMEQIEKNGFIERSKNELLDKIKNF